MSICEIDKKFVWHPFTQEGSADAPVHIVKGEGAYLYDANGKKYLDAIGSWWVNLYGHANPQIADAIAQQARKLEHVIFAGFTHTPAVTLCERLSAYTKPLSRFFFSDNGSTAVEVALKMAYQYWLNQDVQNKKCFVSFEGGYHGDTIGAMSVSPNRFTLPFQGLMFPARQIPFPENYDGVEGIEAAEQKSLEAFLQYCANDDVAALIVEPLIQGAAGMRMCRPEFLDRLVELAKQNNVLVIFDEVMTGFGRTGKMFAYEYIQSTPDFLCVSKGLTGGFLPLSLTITTDKVYEAFYASSMSKAFLHGHSYTGSPLGCAAANAALSLFESGALDCVQEISAVHKERLARLRSLSGISKVRQQGGVAAWSFDGDNNMLKRKLLEQGVFFRPLATECYLIPPYCVNAQSLHQVYDILEKEMQALKNKGF